FLQFFHRQDIGQVALVQLQYVGNRSEIQIVILQMLAQVIEGFEVCVEPLFLRIGDKNHAVRAFQNQSPAGFIKNLSGNRVKMKSGAETAYRAQIERQKIEEKCAVGFGGQRNHLSLLIRSGVFVYPLQIRSLPAEGRTVIDKFAVNFSCGKIYKRD